MKKFYSFLFVACALCVSVAEAANNEVVQCDAVVMSDSQNTIIATEGTQTVSVNGSCTLQSEVSTISAAFSAPGVVDRTVIFTPVNSNTVLELDITSMEVTYSSSTKATFIVYSGAGTDGEVLWEVTEATKNSYNNGPGKVLRSTSADGALTIVYNPNTDKFFNCGAGFTATVSEFLCVESPEISVVEKRMTIPVNEKCNIAATLTKGTAPYNVVVTNAVGKAVGDTVVLNTLPIDNVTVAFTPAECGEYFLTVTDANNKKVSDNFTVIATGEQVPATFESLPLEAESSWSGIYELEDEDDMYRESEFINGSYSFYQGTMPEWSTWWGIAYANITSTTFISYEDQFKNVLGGGYDGSANYGVVYYSSYMGPTCNPSVTVLNAADGDIVKGMYVTNTAYAYNAMTKGDSAARIFVKGDWFKLTATGYDKDGVKTGETDFYLADFRSENEADHYIITDWKYMDLSVLGKVKKIDFTMDSSDTGAWGMNTPAYFCFDNFGAEGEADAIQHATSTAHGSATKAIFSLSGKQQNAMRKGVNIIRMADGSVRKVMK